ncbi:TetR/AcrR family transcriptional regulator [Pandoraea fibrosis]|uniref:TetR family transcriptional regulator n=1 Tax=Pandoraea fibrosis TaxID=1891094 RepID=A0A5E4YJM6_9BURK|nr:TetR/AcrR family transcriptional regulator [Pandoraea fibrosis]QHE93357.1 TetR family transcriptional regulator [Pandoraea fibrosis]QHF13083.1 TetR family transcriptional regulator [Pandoraea fibrosis]VVE49056.1 TetR/AcrR family transcriptional regulator [Pandoraea fibrosis]
MPQVKKEDIRLAILEASHALFLERGYVDTTMVQIAKRAGISHANIYSYFTAKLQVFFCVYETWFKARITALEAEVMAAHGAHARMRTLLGGLLVRTPRLDNGFSHNLVQALATVTPGDPYDPALLQWFRERLSSMLAACAPSLARDGVRRARLVDMLVLTFDGCLVNHHVNPASLPDVAMLEEFLAAFLSAEPAESAESATAPQGVDPAMPSGSAAAA